MVSSYPTKETGADGYVTDVLNPAKSDYSVSPGRLHPKASCEENGAITLSVSASKSCTAPSVNPSLITGNSIRSEWVDYLRSTEGRSVPGSLHVHPFAHPSTRSNNSTFLPPSQWKSTSTPLINSSISLDNASPRPPSSASFIKMGKGSKGMRSASFSSPASGNRWGRVTDGLPLMVQQARKSGSRFWRALTRPSLFSSAEASKDIVTNSPPTIPVQEESRNPSSVLEQLPPRPAPYFYPRHVNPSPCPDSGQTPITPCHSSSNPRYRSNVPPAGSLDAGYSGYGGEDDRASGPSVDSAEIGSWKENRTNYIPTITESQETTSQRPGLPRLGSSIVLRPSSNSSSSQLRYARSEVDLNRAHRELLIVTGDLGPGINDDPFAASPRSLLHPQDSFTPTHSSPALSPALSRTTTPPPLSITTKNLSTPGFEDSASTRGSITNRRSTSENRPASRTQQSAPSTPVPSLLSISIPPPFGEWDDASHSHDSITPFVHEPVVPCSPSETPLLTPDGPSFSHSQGTIARSDTDDSPCSRRGLGFYFPAPDTPEKSFDEYAESALEEGTSRDCAFFEGVAELSAVNVGYGVTYGRPRNSIHSQQAFSIDPSTDEALDDFEDHIHAADVFAVDSDLASLTEEWPLPPRRTLFLDPIPGMSWHRVSSEVEYFKPGTLNTPNRRLRIVGGRLSSSPDMSTIVEGQEVNTSGPQLVKSEPHISSLQRLTTSPVASVVAILGDTVLDTASLPPTLVLASCTEALPAITLAVRAATRPALISFCALHAETRITSSFAVNDTEPAEAYVTIYQRDTAVEDVMTISIGVQHVEPQSISSLDPFGYPSSDFPVRLPITFRELAVAIAQKSFGRVDIAAPAPQGMIT